MRQPSRSSSHVMMCSSPSPTRTEEERSSADATGVADAQGPQPLRRRHSSFSSLRRYSADLDSEAIFLRVEIFLNGLERRLHWLEKYGNLKLDDGINRAYATLDAVRESCSSVSGELIDAGRKRAKQMVEVLDTRYNEALAKKETLEGKAQASMKLMEDFLSDMEARAQAVRDAGLSGVVDEGWRRAETGLKSAKDVVDDGIEHVRQAKEAMKRSIEHAAQRAKEHGLIHYDDLPVPWRVNPHIIRGYRFSENKMDCIRSAFQLSNETVNIWSHAIGLIIILSIAFYFYPTSAHWPLSSKTDIFFAAMFFFAACKCLVCSTMWHTMNSISDQTLMERFACVDYTGISFLVAASIMTTEYTAFYCEPISRWTYILTTAAFGVGGIIVPWAPYFNRADMAWARVAFYVSLAATGFIPVIQLHLTRGIWWVAYFYAPIWKSLLVYFTGAVIYALKVPEIFIPGWFDYFGGSHNIWHFAVLGGILFHYNAMSEMFSGAFERASNDCSIY